MKKIIARIKTLLEAQGVLGQQLIKVAFGSMGMKVASKGLGFLNAILLAKLLGAAGYGIYAYVLALVTFITIPAQMGIPTLATREIAITNVREDWAHMKGLIIRAHQAIVLFGAILVLAALVLLHFFGGTIEPVKLYTMTVGLILVPFMSLAALRGGMLKGLRKIIPGLIPEQVIRPFILMLLLSSLYFLPTIPRTPATAMQYMIIATAVAFGVGLYFFLKLKPAQLSHAQPQYKTFSWLKSSIPLGITAGLVVVNNQTGVLLLGIMKTDADVGVYRLASQIATLVILGMQIINGILAPYIAHLYAKGDMERLQKLVTKSARVVLALTLPIVLVVVVFGELIIDLAFGPEYAAAYIPLVILCSGQLVNASMCSVGILLNMTGHERETTKTMAISAAISAVLHASLIPLWGLTGAALATAITLATWNIILCRKVYIHTRIKAAAFM